MQESKISPAAISIQYFGKSILWEKAKAMTRLNFSSAVSSQVSFGYVHSEPTVWVSDPGTPHAVYAPRPGTKF